ncbi:hypothetical protein E1B28_007059 [Marasmius oreades]|uniref:Uncharacterized protein n=1 Tax=Marasmius oreades TaxID=181124 RepID=A0A9P7UVI4_9AGAR|nr:uncharacterized protein E1B28_007059 [Marasmius oreades]KAG7093379.1 hypothetical protein E1B28_007059 [Marasmius oreades]
MVTRSASRNNPQRGYSNISLSSTKLDPWRRIYLSRDSVPCGVRSIPFSLQTSFKASPAIESELIHCSVVASFESPGKQELLSQWSYIQTLLNDTVENMLKIVAFPKVY